MKNRLVLQSMTVLGLMLILTGCATGPGPASPLIGLTSGYKKGSEGWPDRIQVSMTYVDAVRESGGIPVILPPLTDEDALKTYISELDGLVLVGGYDIPPSAYGEKAEPEVKPMAMERWEFERQLTRRWLDSGKPVLGICLGAQTVNVVQGGTLIQDIPRFVDGKVAHRGDRKDAEHAVTLNADSRLAEILGGTRMTVRAFHHQAVKEVGRGLTVVGRTDDGVIEAMEMQDHDFALFVQWHPERMTGSEHRRKLFDALMNTIRNGK